MSTNLTPLKRKTKKMLRGERYLKKGMMKLKLKVPAFSYLISQLPIVAVKENVVLCTDGEKLYYNAGRIVKENAEEWLCHILLHGLLGHFEEAEQVFRYPELASIVKDIQVLRAKNAVLSNKWEYFFDVEELDELLSEWDEKENYGNTLYYRASEDEKLADLLYRISTYVQRDDHSFWIKKRSKGKAIWEIARMALFKEVKANKEKTSLEVGDAILQQIQNRKWGNESAHGIQEIEEEGQAETAYDMMLREILALSESCKEEDEIDKALYMYGLELYGDVPIVEPQEYKEVIHVETLVIALDTSGSCTGRAASFIKEVRKLFTDMQTTGFEVAHIYILQCDTDILEEEYYDDVTQFLEATSNYRIIGGGGTSFVPVFERVNDLCKTQKVEALFYLTDGAGMYPQEMEQTYPAYFLLAPDDMDYVPYLDEKIQNRIHWCPVVMLEEGKRR